MTAKSAESLDSGLEQERSTKLTVASRPAHYDSLVVALIALTFTTGLIDAVSSETPVNRLYAVIILTAIAMGLRNATVRRLAVPDLTTTVLTLTLTGLAADSSLAGGNNPRSLRRIFSVVAMFGGAAIGAILLRYGLALPVVVASVCVLGATVACAHTEVLSEAQ